ncbi:hypothetical protein [Flagellimonas amoyensis]|uniref:hypothetical protein n=1 Tax=Flagellimonas amoyensis TaxID=2169401 RepID=UPI00131EDFC5|nr:hypothetical protein [Allomuricauda amoyensis]
MVRQILKMFVSLCLMLAIISCNSNHEAEANSTATPDKEIIPDSIVQFLITSASTDFRNHKPPTPMNFRDVKVGFLTASNDEKTFVLCGEFLSQEDNEWIAFTTIKTLGYEQYIGKTQYCQDATMILTDENLAVALKDNWDTSNILEKRNIAKTQQ